MLSIDYNMYFCPNYAWWLFSQVTWQLPPIWSLNNVIELVATSTTWVGLVPLCNRLALKRTGRYWLNNCLLLVYFRMTCDIICNLSHGYFYCLGMQTFTLHVGADDTTWVGKFSFVISVLQFPALQEMWITKETNC